MCSQLALKLKIKTQFTVNTQLVNSHVCSQLFPQPMEKNAKQAMFRPILHSSTTCELLKILLNNIGQFDATKIIIWILVLRRAIVLLQCLHQLSIVKDYSLIVDLG